MSEESSPERSRRPALILGAGLLLLTLAALVLGAALLPGSSLELVANGLESSSARVEAAFTAGVDEDLRQLVREELAAQSAWLRSLEPLDLPPERARAAAWAAESLADLLADDELTPQECRSFLSLGQRARAEAP